MGNGSRLNGKKVENGPFGAFFLIIFSPTIEVLQGVAAVALFISSYFLFSY